MKQTIKTFEKATNGQGLYEITKEIIKFVKESKLKNGLLTIYILHTSCSLLIQENADKTVQKDLLSFSQKSSTTSASASDSEANPLFFL